MTPSKEVVESPEVVSHKKCNMKLDKFDVEVVGTLNMIFSVANFNCLAQIPIVNRTIQ